MNITESFVYKWTNTESGMIYIGKHTGSPDDGYIGSSDTFLCDYYKDPHLFFREILHFGPRDLMNKKEFELLREHFLKNGDEGIYNKGPFLLNVISSQINKLLVLQQKESTSERGDELRRLRHLKKKYIKKHTSF